MQRATHHNSLHHARATGFTLVELLVATTISALLVVSVVSATRALSGARKSVERRVTCSQAARRAIDEIAGALRNVRRDPVRGQPVLIGQSAEQAGGSDRLDLLVIEDRRVRPDGPESDQHEIGFFLANLPDRPLPVLMCRRDHAFDEFPDEGGVATVIAEGIVQLAFDYYDGTTWYPQWPETEMQPPEAVRITLAAQPTTPPPQGGRDRPLVLSTVVALHVNPPSEPPPPEQPDQARPPQPQPNAQPEGGPQ